MKVDPKFVDYFIDRIDIPLRESVCAWGAMKAEMQAHVVIEPRILSAVIDGVEYGEYVGGEETGDGRRHPAFTERRPVL
jgi:hypothetical protein